MGPNGSEGVESEQLRCILPCQTNGRGRSIYLKHNPLSKILGPISWYQFPRHRGMLYSVRSLKTGKIFPLILYNSHRDRSIFFLLILNDPPKHVGGGTKATGVKKQGHRKYWWKKEKELLSCSLFNRPAWDLPTCNNFQYEYTPT